MKQVHSNWMSPWEQSHFCRGAEELAAWAEPGFAGSTPSCCVLDHLQLEGTVRFLAEVQNTVVWLFIHNASLCPNGWAVALILW